jgi:hypothetical protein
MHLLMYRSKDDRLAVAASHPKDSLVDSILPAGGVVVVVVVVDVRFAASMLVHHHG